MLALKLVYYLRVAQFGRARRLGRRGRKFKSFYADHLEKKIGAREVQKDVWEYLQLAEERGQAVARKAGVKWSAQPIKYMFAAACYVVYIDVVNAHTIATARTCTFN